MLLNLSKKQLKKLADVKYDHKKHNKDMFQNSVAIAKNFSNLYGNTRAYLIKLQDGTLVYYDYSDLPLGTSRKYSFID